MRRGKVLLELLVWVAAEGLPFERLAVLVNQQEFTKTANCWGVNNNVRGTNTNRIVLLRRTPPACIKARYLMEKVDSRPGASQGRWIRAR